MAHEIYHGGLRYKGVLDELYESKSDSALLQMINTGRDNETGESIFTEGWFASGRNAQGFIARGKMSQRVFLWACSHKDYSQQELLCRTSFSIGFLSEGYFSLGVTA